MSVGGGDVPRAGAEESPVCCSGHMEGCWYDACCDACPERERCRARLGEARCTLPVSEHRDPRSTNPEDHVWTAPIGTSHG